MSGCPRGRVTSISLVRPKLSSLGTLWGFGRTIRPFDFPTATALPATAATLLATGAKALAHVAVLVAAVVLAVPAAAVILVFAVSAIVFDVVCLAVVGFNGR